VKADDSLIASLRAKFDGGDEYKMPALFEFVPDLPKTPTGKVKRAELRGRNPT